MIKIACLNYNNTFLANFNNHEIAIYYFNDVNELVKSDFFGIIILRDKSNINLKKSVAAIKKLGFEYIYVIDRNMNKDKFSEFLDLGISDYFSYPIGYDFLTFKIIKDFKESEKNKNSNFIFEDLFIDTDSQMVFIAEGLINLTLLEYKLLLVLTANMDKAMSKGDLVNSVWNYETKDYRNLETHIKTLRKKLKKYKSNIITIWGYGYSFSSRCI